MSSRGRLLALALAVVLGSLLSWGAWRLSREPPPASGGADGFGRVIPFAPNLVEACFVLGLGERVVGVPDFTVWPPAAEALPRVGGIVDPNLERIASLEPDLLVVQGENRSLREFARQQSIALAEVKMDDDLASIGRGLVQLDSLLRGSGSTRGVAVWDSLSAGLDSLREASPGRPRPVTLLVLGHAPGSLEELFTAGAGSFLNELVEVAGGAPMYSDRPRRYFHLGQEALLARPPDIALEFRPGDDDTPASELQRPWSAAGLDQVHLRVVRFDGAMVPGPRILETARAIHHQLHGGGGDP